MSTLPRATPDPSQRHTEVSNDDRHAPGSENRGVPGPGTGTSSSQARDSRFLKLLSDILYCATWTSIYSAVGLYAAFVVPAMLFPTPNFKPGDVFLPCTVGSEIVALIMALLLNVIPP